MKRIAVLMAGCMAGMSLALEAHAQESTCGNLGTAIMFEDSIEEAAAKAKRRGKLVLALHVSGEFNDPALT